MENRPKSLLITLLALLLAPATASADPITIVATLAPLIGGTAAAFVATYGAGMLAVGLALNMTAQARRKAKAMAARQRAEYNASLADRMATIVSADAPQKVVYGRSYVGGTIVAMFTTDRPTPPQGATDGPNVFSGEFKLEGKNKDALRHLVVVLTAHECEALGSVRVDGTEVGPLDADGYPTSGEFFKAQDLYMRKSFVVPASGVLNLGTAPKSVEMVTSTYDLGDRGRVGTTSHAFTLSGANVQVSPTLLGQTVVVTFSRTYQMSSVRVRLHRGYPGEPADAYLMSVLPDKWTADHRLSGYSYAVLTLDLNERRFQGGPPSFQVDVLGKKVYDPRNGLTAWSDNPALCAADFLNSSMWAGNSRVSVIQADLVAAANVCDEAIDNYTGQVRVASDFLDVWKVAGFGFVSPALLSTKIRRYTCNGSFSTDDDPESVLDYLRESMAGDAFVAGGWRLFAGAWATPVATLDIAQADGQVEVSQVGASWGSVVNSVRGNFLPVTEVASKDFEPYINGALEGADGQRLWDDLSFPFTNQQYRCHNLARIRVEKSRNGLVLRWPASVEAWGLQPGDRVWVKYPTLLGSAPKTFRVTEWSFSLSSPVMLTLEEDSPATWDLVDQTVPDQTPNTTLPDPFYVPGVVSLSASSGEPVDLMLLADGSVIPSITLSWARTDEVPTGSTITIQYTRDAAGVTPVLSHRVPADQSGTRLTGVTEGEILMIRARYETSMGEGPWSVISHSVVGKLAPPSAVPSASLALSEGYLVLTWGEVGDVDVNTYEVRLADTGWGDDLHVFKGSARSCQVEAAAAGTARTWYVRALDSSGKYSTVSRSASYTLAAVPTPSGGSYSYSDTSLTSAEVLLEWGSVVSPLGAVVYEVTYAGNVVPSATSRITLPADWIGVRSFTVTAIDRAGNRSSGMVIPAEKLAPASVTGLRAQVIDNVVMLYWKLPARTSLPLSHVRIKRGATWATAIDVGTKSGEFTTITELVGGVFSYWVAAVDTDDNESTPVGVVANVSQPPDFKFNGQFVSDFSGTLSNAVLDGAGVLLPVNTTETFAQHFTTRGWASVADQIAAGYPLYTQPGATSGYYEQIYDYGSSLGSSNVTVELEGESLAGSPTVTVTLSFSNGGAYTDYPGVTSVFATAFRYVKVRVEVTQTAVGGTYKINALRLNLQSKLKNDSGSAAIGDATAAPNGTVINFNSEFVDIESITSVGMGTAQVTAVTEFKDSLLYGTYSVTSNVATITATAHELVVGQNVRLDFSSGLGIRGVYTVASVPNANSFTVSMGASNTSGSVTAYWSGFRVRLYNAAGTRVSGTVSWAARGY